MNNNEVNKIIAEYMGDPCGNCYEYGCNTCRDSVGFQGEIAYTSSLDALDPVLAKLNVTGIKAEKLPMNEFQIKRWKIRIYIGSGIKERGIAETQSEALSLAVARAINETNK